MGVQVGQKVVALKNIGGIMREAVPKGSVGVVTRAGGMFSGETRVLFTIERPILGNKQVEISVSADEIA